MGGYQLDIHQLLEVLTFLGGLLGHALFLSNRIQKIEDSAVANAKMLDRHMAEDREDLRRIYDKIEAKADKGALRVTA